jgi:hypothetical protein
MSGLPMEMLLPRLFLMTPMQTLAILLHMEAVVLASLETEFVSQLKAPTSIQLVLPE